MLKKISSYFGGPKTTLVTYDETLLATQRIRTHIYPTPLTFSPHLSALIGHEIHIKWDNKLRTGSFKERGALNFLLTLKEAHEGGILPTVCAASAGNHALGLSYHAEHLQFPCVVVMPKHAPLIKVESVERFGGTVILHGDTFDEAKEYALNLVKERGYTYISPFDDARIVAGQASMAHEILEALPSFDSLVVPVGGGGLISGLSLVVKEKLPECHILGVQSDWAISEADPLKNLAFKLLSLADGIAVKKVGALTGQMIAQYVDNLTSVTESEIARAIITLLELEKTVVEGAGAAGLAALFKKALPPECKKTVLVVCGSNIDLSVLSRLISHDLVARERVIRITTSVPDRPGVLHKLAGVIADEGANVIDILHDRSFSRVPGSVEVIFLMEVKDVTHSVRILEKLKSLGLEARRIE
jgi:threonine dehydratase